MSNLAPARDSDSLQSAVASLIRLLCKDIEVAARAGQSADKLVKRATNKLRHLEAYEPKFMSLPLVALLRKRLASHSVADEHEPERRIHDELQSAVDALSKALNNPVQSDQSELPDGRESELRVSAADAVDALLGAHSESDMEDELDFEDASELGDGDFSDDDSGIFDEESEAVYESEPSRAQSSAASRDWLFRQSGVAGARPTSSVRSVRSVMSTYASHHHAHHHGAGEVLFSEEDDDNENSGVAHLSFGGEMPPFELLGPLIEQLLTDDVDQQRGGLDGLSQFLAGDMLATQDWPQLRLALIHLLDSQPDIASRALRLVAELFDAAQPSPQTGEIFTLLAQNVLHIELPLSKLPADLSTLFAESNSAASNNEIGSSVYSEASWALRRVSVLLGMMLRLPLFWLHYTDALARSVFTSTLLVLLKPLESLSEFLVCENDPTSPLPWQSIALGFAPPNVDVEPSFTCGHLLGWLDPSAQWMRRWLLAAHARDFFFAAASRTAWSQLLSLACLSVPRHVTEWTHGDVASNVAQASLLHCEFLWSQSMILIGYQHGRRLLQPLPTESGKNALSVIGCLGIDPFDGLEADVPADQRPPPPPPELTVETGLNLQRIHQFLYNSEFGLAGNSSVVQHCIIVGLQLLESIVSNVQKFTSVSSAAALETQTDAPKSWEWKSSQRLVTSMLHFIDRLIACSPGHQCIPPEMLLQLASFTQRLSTCTSAAPLAAIAFLTSASQGSHQSMLHSNSAGAPTSHLSSALSCAWTSLAGLFSTHSACLQQPSLRSSFCQPINSSSCSQVAQSAWACVSSYLKHRSSGAAHGADGSRIPLHVVEAAVGFLCLALSHSDSFPAAKPLIAGMLQAPWSTPYLQLSSIATVEGGSVFQPLELPRILLHIGCTDQGIQALAELNALPALISTLHFLLFPMSTVSTPATFSHHDSSTTYFALHAPSSFSWSPPPSAEPIAHAAVAPRRRAHRNAAVTAATRQGKFGFESPQCSGRTWSWSQTLLIVSNVTSVPEGLELIGQSGFVSDLIRHLRCQLFLAPPKSGNYSAEDSCNCCNGRLEACVCADHSEAPTSSEDFLLQRDNIQTDFQQSIYRDCEGGDSLPVPDARLRVFHVLKSLFSADGFAAMARQAPWSCLTHEVLCCWLSRSGSLSSSIGDVADLIALQLLSCLVSNQSGAQFAAHYSLPLNDADRILLVDALRSMQQFEVLDYEDCFEFVPALTSAATTTESAAAELPRFQVSADLPLPIRTVGERYSIEDAHTALRAHILSLIEQHVA